MSKLTGQPWPVFSGVGLTQAQLIYYDEVIRRASGQPGKPERLKGAQRERIFAAAGQRENNGNQ